VEPERRHNALLDSLKLSGSGHYQEALQLMDEVIAEASKEGDGLSALVLIGHAALLNGAKRDRSILRHYYEQFLTYNPENPRVLYESADVAMKDGQIEIARLYAKRCHQAILRSDDDKIKKDLLDLVIERWPEVAE
jgi:Tfp pilus assembly protein PilF